MREGANDPNYSTNKPRNDPQLLRLCLQSNRWKMLRGCCFVSNLQPGVPLTIPHFLFFFLYAATEPGLIPAQIPLISMASATRQLALGNWENSSIGHYWFQRTSCLLATHIFASGFCIETCLCSGNVPLNLHFRCVRVIAQQFFCKYFI